MRNLRLRTIVSLVPGTEPVKDLREFCEQYGVEHRHFQVARFRDEVTLGSSLISQLLALLVDRSQLPLLLHCVDGTHISGLVVLCLRKLQLWSRAASQAEFGRFAHLSSAEAQFVESFGGELATISLPGSTPDWLWGGGQYTRHPTITIVDARQSAQPQGTMPEETSLAYAIPEASVGYTPAATPSAGAAGAASAAGGGGGAGAGAGVDSLAEKPEDEEELGCAHKISLRNRLREAGPQALSLSGCRRPLI